MSTLTAREEASMAYAIYSEHPESAQRKAEDFTSWSIWAAENAPWAGISVPDMASLLQGVCNKDDAAAACAVLDQGGVLAPADVLKVRRYAADRMNEKTLKVFTHAAEHRYPVRVVFSKGFGAPSASTYLANATSA
jgi:hypothetical protein